MQTLSPTAAVILACMEPDRSYEPLELRAFVPDVSMDRVREIMHELWVNRRVERYGYSGWRLERSMSAIEEAAHPQRRAAGSPAQPVAPPETKGVKPEDLFDHDAFSGMFK